MTEIPGHGRSGITTDVRTHVAQDTRREATSRTELLPGRRPGSG